MKTLIVAVLVSVVMLAGCWEVHLSQTYRNLVYDSRAIAAIYADQCKKGTLDPNSVCEVLDLTVQRWDKFIAASEGRAD